MSPRAAGRPSDVTAQDAPGSEPCSSRAGEHGPRRFSPPGHLALPCPAAGTSGPRRAAPCGHSRPRSTHRGAPRIPAGRGCCQPGSQRGTDARGNEAELAGPRRLRGGEAAGARGGRSSCGAPGCAEPGQGSAPRRQGHAGTRLREGRSAPQSSDGAGCRAFPTAYGAGGVEKINGEGCS